MKIIAVCAALSFSLANIAPSRAASEQTVITGSCSAVVVNSNLSAPIEISCGTPPEEAAFTKLTEGPQTEECVFTYPTIWTRHGDSANDTGQLTPPPGNTLSKYGFVFKYTIFETTAWQYTYINAITLESGGNITNDKMSEMGLTKDALKSLADFRSQKPDMIIQSEDYDKAVDKSEPVVDPILVLKPLRTTIKFEDGSDIESSHLDVYAKDEKLRSEVLVTTFVDAYPSLDSEMPDLYSFSCEAELEMPTDLFAKLCSYLIEQTTLSPQFTELTCRMSESNKFTKYTKDGGS
jgi:hypothetical protein